MSAPGEVMTRWVPASRVSAESPQGTAATDCPSSSVVGRRLDPYREGSTVNLHQVVPAAGVEPFGHAVTGPTDSSAIAAGRTTVSP